MSLNIKSFWRKLAMSAGAGLLLATAPLALVHAAPPISLSSCQDLQKIGNDVSHPLSGDYVLANDIDCTAATSSGGALYNSGKGFAPIGDSANPFTGTFNGQGYTISGLKINRSSDTYVGLFSNTVGATVENVNFVGASVRADSYVGIVTGEEKSITLNNVTATGAVSTPTNGNGYAGGLIGYNKANSSGASQLTSDYFGGSVSSASDSIAGLIGDNDGDAVVSESASNANITCDGSVNSCNYIGGLVGDTDGNLTVSKSFSIGTINGDSATGDSVGGLVGWSDGIAISDSFSIGNIIGKDNVGGLLGDAGSGTVDRSYSSGSVTGGGVQVGGFVGYDGMTITSSFFNKSKTNLNACGNNASCTGVTGLTSTQMQDKSNFTGAGWNFANTWTHDSSVNNGFPYLQSAAVTESKLNPITGKNVEVKVEPGCMLDSMDLQEASANATKDNGYSYPDGMVNFSVSCGTAGFTTQITSYIFGVTKGKFVVRKYNTGTHQYATVPGATITFTKYNGESAAKIVYSVKDGGSLDSDGAANGTVVDPVGLAVSVGAPNTGAGTPAVSIAVPAGMVLLGSAGIVTVRKYSRR